MDVLVSGFNRFPVIAGKIHTALKQSVHKTATDMRNLAADYAPKATGFLSGSIYVTDAYGSTYGQGVQKVGKLKPRNGVISRRRIQNYSKRRAKQRAQEALLTAEIPPPPDDLSAYVVVGATYGVFVEYGTSRMSAQPFFHPAVESMRSVFEWELSTLEAKIAGGL